MNTAIVVVLGDTLGVVRNEIRLHLCSAASTGYRCNLCVMVPVVVWGRNVPYIPCLGLYIVGVGEIPKLIRSCNGSRRLLRTCTYRLSGQIYIRIVVGSRLIQVVSALWRFVLN